MAVPPRDADDYASVDGHTASDRAGRVLARRPPRWETARCQSGILPFVAILQKLSPEKLAEVLQDSTRNESEPGGDTQVFEILPAMPARSPEKKW